MLWQSIHRHRHQWPSMRANYASASVDAENNRDAGSSAQSASTWSDQVAVGDNNKEVATYIMNWSTMQWIRKGFKITVMVSGRSPRIRSASWQEVQ